MMRQIDDQAVAAHPTECTTVGAAQRFRNAVEPIPEKVSAEESEDKRNDRKIIGGEESGVMKTNLGGKLSISAELAGAGEVKIEIKK